MAHFNFVIPSKREDLASENDDYFVRDLIQPKEIINRLKDIKLCLKEEGPEFILENFPVFYSILYYEDTLQMDIIYKSYQDLHKAVEDLTKSLGFLLEDRSSITEELGQKYQNVIKMLIYIYVQTVLVIEAKNIIKAKNEGLLKGRKKITNLMFHLDKKNVLLALNNIFQMEIGLFWDPPVVEENLINIVAEVCYKFLENPLIKGEKETREEVFNLIGTLLQTYNHSTTFTIRIVQMIKNEEHLIQCIPDGIKQLVVNFGCKGLIHALVQEITEWQTEEKFQDSQGSRFCAQFLTALAVSLPELMLPEVLYLNKYLYHEPATLRNSVLNVITEVIVHVLSKHNLNNEEAEYQEGFLTILTEHIRDNSAHVRARVMQHWSRLQEATAIPRHLVNDVLKKIVVNHLHDRSALVRKNAANCITTFLQYNTFGAHLSLSKMQEELKEATQLLDEFKPQIEQAKMLKSQEMEAQWEQLIPDLKKMLLELLQMENAAEDNEEHQLTKKDASELIRMYLREGRYKEAIKMWRKSADELEMDEESNEGNIMEEFVSRLKVIYMEDLQIMDEAKNGISHGDLLITEEDFQKFEVLEKKVEYLQEAVSFLTIMDEAINLMKELLETTCISDMHEAVAFFIAAYQFGLDNAKIGIMAMLPLMKRNEQDRKDVVIEAFKIIYLKTNASDMTEHGITVVNRLIDFLKFVPSTSLYDLEEIIREWVSKGILDNSIIDVLWKYFTKKISVSDEQSHASMELLRMAALGRSTIITRNVMVVSCIAFGEVGRKNLAFFGSACNFLSLAGKEKTDIHSENHSFKINHKDPIWTNLFTILKEKFFEREEFYYHALVHAMNFLYQVCGKPQEICDAFLKQILGKLSGQKELECFIYIRLCQLLGIVAIEQLNFLDGTVYKELKRRENIRIARKGSDLKKKKNKKINTISASTTANSSISTVAKGDEINLEGEQADDEDAEFILQVLEKNTVTGQGVLAQLAYVIVSVCEKQELFANVHLQGAAVTAMIRYMLVSSDFARKHIQLLFTILEKTKYSEIKTSILGHLSDLLTRFPNIIEPWTSKIYERLKDPSIEIRKTTFFSVSSLILRDMIRAHSYVHLMSNQLIDPDEELNSMCRTFFITLAQKEDNLYNILPDIFSHLIECNDISEENIKYIMKFLFALITKQKHMENLVDRFSFKFELTDDIHHQRNIAYCLTLITYNEKALKKLHGNFGTYKHLMQDDEIYAHFKAVMQACLKQPGNKTDLKQLVAELENSIKTVFEVNNDGEPKKPPHKLKSSRKARKKRQKTKESGDAESDSD
ncbi:condensin complex subunit 1 isoform X2 [Euwallacea similis]|uniref:condensin complex subunit 1 isoform X2 n=1 Tax=Euwallacea similis TaxID=1736056 RepID=UPI00345087F0